MLLTWEVRREVALFERPTNVQAGMPQVSTIYIIYILLNLSTYLFVYTYKHDVYFLLLSCALGQVEFFELPTYAHARMPKVFNIYI